MTESASRRWTFWLVVFYKMRLKMERGVWGENRDRGAGVNGARRITGSAETLVSSCTFF